ncbi:hypothetical protein PROFUN_12449, partial [Planoprotostelium fungivorum]
PTSLHMLPLTPILERYADGLIQILERISCLFSAETSLISSSRAETAEAIFMSDEGGDLQPSNKNEKEFSLPRTRLLEVIKSAMPEGFHPPAAKDYTMQLMNDACIEFMQLVASQAMVEHSKGNPKTEKVSITPKHVLNALRNLDYKEYAETAKRELNLDEGRTTSRQPTKRLKKTKADMEREGEALRAEQEALRVEQEKLFAQAREKMNQKNEK